MTSVTILIPAGFQLNLSFVPNVPLFPPQDNVIDVDVGPVNVIAEDDDQSSIQLEQEAQVEVEDDLITQADDEPPREPRIWPNAQPGSFLYSVDTLINQHHVRSQEFSPEECALLLDVKEMNSGTFGRVMTCLGLAPTERKKLTARLWRMSHPDAVRRYQQTQAQRRREERNRERGIWHVNNPAVIL